jgi:hypothetical protein
MAYIRGEAMIPYFGGGRVTPEDAFIHFGQAYWSASAKK